MVDLSDFAILHEYSQSIWKYVPTTLIGFILLIFSIVSFVIYINSRYETALPN